MQTDLQSSSFSLRAASDHSSRSVVGSPRKRTRLREENVRWGMVEEALHADSELAGGSPSPDKRKVHGALVSKSGLNPPSDTCVLNLGPFHLHNVKNFVFPFFCRRCINVFFVAGTFCFLFSFFSSFFFLIISFYFSSLCFYLFSSFHFFILFSFFFTGGGPEGVEAPTWKKCRGSKGWGQRVGARLCLFGTPRDSRMWCDWPSSTYSGCKRCFLLQMLHVVKMNSHLR